MQPKTWLTLAFAALAVVALAALASAQGQAVISSGPTGVSLGIASTGQLTAPGTSPSNNCVNSLVYPGLATMVSLRYNPSNDDGMDCDFEGEGWGLSYSGGPVGMGYKSWSAYEPSSSGNCAYGTLGYPPAGSTPLSSTFYATATEASSEVTIGSLIANQTYRPYGAAYPSVYRDDITITNSGNVAVNGVVYRRVMSWGSPQRADDATFQSIDTLPISGGYVPPQVVATAIVGSSACPNPTAAYGSGVVANGPPPAGTVVTNAYGDVAMVWDFNFGTLAPGQSETFTLYYGGAGTHAAALAILNGIQAQIYD
ncbi:MAG: hypothetical protein LC620_03395, partial [Halobacteriales archaeon]|nr:hypothetical protein [Halobacteriales archaeon]